MTCRHLDADALRYSFCPDDTPRPADRLRAVISGVVRDEITGEAPAIELTVRSAHPALRPRVARGGLVGLVGNPGRLFPSLDTTSVDLTLSIAAHGYLPRRLKATLGPINTFPGAFEPADLGVILLHREAVSLRGRVVQRTGLYPTPIAEVSLSLAGVWSTYPPHNVDPNTVMEPPNVVSLSPGLYADRAEASAGLRRRAMDFADGKEKRLLAPAVPGDITVRLSNRVELNPGDVLAFEAGIKDRVEYVRVADVHPASTDDQPAGITLAHPLALAHGEGASCVRAIPGAQGADYTLLRDGIRRERVAFLNNVISDLADGDVVEISGGSAPAEYQIAALYNTKSDEHGFFRLPPLSRVASVKLRASRLDLPTPQEPVFSPDYRRYENQLDVVFP